MVWWADNDDIRNLGGGVNNAVPNIFGEGKKPNI